MEIISPRVDIAFKKLFGVEENKDLLISLINATVCPEDRVADITLLNPYNLQNFGRDKLSILDIKAQGENGKRFNIEIQINDGGDYRPRALYYWAKLYTEQLKQSDDYYLLSKAIGIHILNFTSMPDSGKYHNMFRIKEDTSNLHYFKDFEIHTIELPKFAENTQENLSTILNKVKNSLDIWVAFLTRNDLMNKKQLPKALDTPELKKALTVLEVMNFGPGEREIYEGQLKWFRDKSAALKRRFAQGKAEGNAAKTAEIALNLLRMGLDIEQIIQATGLSLADIEKLRNGKEIA